MQPTSTAVRWPDAGLASRTVLPAKARQQQQAHGHEETTRRLWNRRGWGTEVDMQCAGGLGRVRLVEVEIACGVAPVITSVTGSAGRDDRLAPRDVDGVAGEKRSEEHTSELQP